MQINLQLLLTSCRLVQRRACSLETGGWIENSVRDCIYCIMVFEVSGDSVLSFVRACPGFALGQCLRRSKYSHMERERRCKRKLRNMSRRRCLKVSYLEDWWNCSAEVRCVGFHATNLRHQMKNHRMKYLPFYHAVLLTDNFPPCTKYVDLVAHIIWVHQLQNLVRQFCFKKDRPRRDYLIQYLCLMSVDTELNCAISMIFWATKMIHKRRCRL